MPASETLRCKQCGGIAEEARRIYATPVCFKCLPPPPPLKHQEIRRPSTSAELIAEARKLSDSLFCGNSLVRELANALEAATRPLPDGEAARLIDEARELAATMVQGKTWARITARLCDALERSERERAESATRYGDNLKTIADDYVAEEALAVQAERRRNLAEREALAAKLAEWERAAQHWEADRDAAVATAIARGIEDNAQLAARVRELEATLEASRRGTPITTDSPEFDELSRLVRSLR